MLDTIGQIDHELFAYINHGISNEFFDSITVFVREKIVWLLLYLFLISFFIFNFSKKGILIILFAFLTAGSSDYISASIIKPYVERLRPCNDVNNNPDIVIRVGCGHGYSFPSSHASNHFAIATFFFLAFGGIVKKRYSSILFLWALLISLSQVYVGVHYPSDIFVGSLLGISIGIILYYLEEKTASKIFKKV
ncbi:MAG: phosphatase PAP2 family protein [Saprospiraceae bacterium]